MSSDPLLDSGRPEDPQSWNRYAYTLNNPLRFIDPLGLEEMSAEDCQKDPDCVSVRLHVILDKNAAIFDKKGNLLPGVQKTLDSQIAYRVGVALMLDKCSEI